MIDVLNKYYEQGLVYKQTHPTLPLTIWNYTEKVQYENLWDEITIQTRGLVTDDKGNIVARPFKKFFNLEEKKHPPTHDFEVFDKMDGSLGILFNYGGEWIMATRGSFTSDQAIKGFELIQKYEYKRLVKGFTYLFEIIYPENRIVVNYDYEDLILLSVIDNKDGYELKIFDDSIHIEGIRLRNLFNNLGFRLVKKYDGIKDYNTLKNMVKDNEEGGGNFEDLLKDVPDEFYTKIKDYSSSLRYSFYQIREDAGKKFDYFMYGKYNDKEPITDKKEFAMWVLKQPQYLQPILFKMFDKKEYSSYIWKLVKPEFRKL